jgi:hypothetical protein
MIQFWIIWWNFSSALLFFTQLRWCIKITVFIYTVFTMCNNAPYRVCPNISHTFFTKIDAFKIKAWLVVVLKEKETRLDCLDPVEVLHTSLL